MTSSAAGSDNVRPLHRVRVLLVGRDPHYLKVVGFLLSRQGFAVESTRKRGQVLELVEQLRPNVVVVDASDSVGAAARLVGAIEALHPSVAAVAVAERESEAPMASFAVLPKWDFARLVEEVQSLYVKRRDEKEAHLGAR